MSQRRRNTAQSRNGELQTRRFIQFHSRQEEIAYRRLSRKHERLHRTTCMISKNKTSLGAYFSLAWPSDGTGVPLPLGNMILCGRTPAFSFFSLFHLSDHPRPRPSSAPTALLNRAWSRGCGYMDLIGISSNQ